MSTLIDALKQQIAHTLEVRRDDAKRLQEKADVSLRAAQEQQVAANAAHEDVLALEAMLAVSAVEPDDLEDSHEPSEVPNSLDAPLRVTLTGGSDGEKYAVTVRGAFTEEGMPLQTSHVIDVGAIAAQIPVQNPFREKPNSPDADVWEVMKHGESWSVLNDLKPILQWSESAIRSVLKRNPDVFEGSLGIYHVTARYCVRREG